ncbi:MAG TPA: hypothetical protein VK784_10635, partial [Pseudonocardiaceae bacterium]|nr:hypothetical protein [Pseudonocardiaceae bacterium]
REGAVHLLMADDVLAGKIGGTYLALCGALVPASHLPPSSCPPDCDCALFCPECVRVVTECTTETGQADRASGVAR